MKILLILLITPIQLFCQQWFPMNQGVTNNNPQGCAVGDIAEYQGKIIIGGYFKKSNATTLNSIAQWNGYQWQSMGKGIWWGDGGSIDSAGTIQFNGLTEYNGKLYASGAMEGAGGSHINDLTHSVLNITKWEGTDWFPLTSPPLPSGVAQSCSALGVYNNNLYLGGGFNHSYDTSGVHVNQGIVKWNDTVFSPIGQLAGDFPPNNFFDVMSFCNYQNKLIAGGFFTSINGSAYGTYSGIAAWDDTQWSSLGVGFNNAVYSLAILDDTLYAAGLFTATRDNLTSLNHIAKWNGTNWLPVGVGLNDSVIKICADTIHHLLYAGGLFTQTGSGQPANHLAVWDGSTWQSLGGGTNSAVCALYIKDSNLYVGGNFTQVGSGISANRIACWGNNPTGVPEYKEENDVSIYPNPTSGVFTISAEANKITQIKITNTIGQQIKTITNIETIDLTNTPKGIYFVEIKTDKGTTNKKIILQ